MGCGLQMGNGRSPDGSHAPLKSRTTWAGDEMSGTMNQENSAAKKVSRRKTVSQNTGTRDDSPDTGENSHTSTSIKLMYNAHVYFPNHSRCIHQYEIELTPLFFFWFRYIDTFIQYAHNYCN